MAIFWKPNLLIERKKNNRYKCNTIYVIWFVLCQVEKESIGSHEVSDLIWRAHCYEQDPPDFNWLIWIRPSTIIHRWYINGTLWDTGGQWWDTTRISKKCFRKMFNKIYNKIHRGGHMQLGEEVMTYSMFLWCHLPKQTLSRAFGRLSFDLSAQISKKDLRAENETNIWRRIRKGKRRVASMERFYGQKQAANG